MKKPARTICTLSEADLKKLADRAVYSGSVEHKDTRSWLGIPRLRQYEGTEEIGYKQNATICPLVSEEEKNKASSWVKIAIKNRQFNRTMWDGEFPREIWHRESYDQYWFGRLTQRGTGGDSVAEYKGWPISKKEWHEIFN